MENRFTLAGLEFDVTHSELFGFVDPPTIDWGVEIKAKALDPGFVASDAQFTSDGLFRTRRLKEWKTLVPRRSCWIPPRDTDATPSAMVYVVSHSPLYLATARLFAQKGTIRLRVKGRFGVLSRLDIDTSIEMRGIMCGRQSEEESFEEISRVLDPSEFVFTKDHNGVSIMRPAENWTTTPDSTEIGAT